MSEAAKAIRNDSRFYSEPFTYTPEPLDDIDSDISMSELVDELESFAYSPELFDDFEPDTETWN